MITIPKISIDCLNPILLKELRQAVRSRQFVASFMLLQLAMIYFVFLGAAAHGTGNEEERLVATFWTIVSLYLCVISPLTAMGALSQEFAESRLELLQLTQLQSRGIVMGKWLTQVLQSLLVISSLLPYTVIRYFLGSVNPLHDLGILLLLIFISVTLNALAVCLSVIKSKFLKGLIPLFLIFVMPPLVLSAANISMGFGMTGFFDTTQMIQVTLLAVLYGAQIILLLLEFAASRISHEAQNHETSKRLIALSGVVTCVFAYFVSDVLFFSLFFLQGIMFLIVAISAIMHEPRRLPSVYVPLLRTGFLGRCFLYPGWPSATSFLLLAVALHAGLLALRARLDPMTGDELIVAVYLYIGLIGSIVLPRAVYSVVKFRKTSNMRVFILIQLAAGVIAFTLLILDEFSDGSASLFLCFLPQAGLLNTFRAIDMPTDSFMMTYIAGMSVTTIICLSIIFVKGRQWAHYQSGLLEQAAKIRELRRDRLKTHANA